MLKYLGAALAAKAFVFFAHNNKQSASFFEGSSQEDFDCFKIIADQFRRKKDFYFEHHAVVLHLCPDNKVLLVARNDVLSGSPALFSLNQIIEQPHDPEVFQGFTDSLTKALQVRQVGGVAFLGGYLKRIKDNLNRGDVTSAQIIYRATTNEIPKPPRGTPLFVTVDALKKKLAASDLDLDPEAAEVLRHYFDKPENCTPCQPHKPRKP